MNRIKEIIHENGFLHDEDLYEVSELIIEECCRFLKDNMHTERASEEFYCNNTIAKVRKHFGIK